MQRTPQRNNPKELAVRSALHAAGLRFRVHYRALPSARTEADIAFPRQRLAVMIDGCFWHRCPEHGTMPRRNASWWQEKLAANAARDQRSRVALTAAGWQVVRFWEHQSEDDVVGAVKEALLGS